MADTEEGRGMIASGRAATTQQPCTYHLGACGRTDTRPHQCGGRWRCPDHTPAKLAGQPEPDSARYCPPAICYCGGCINRRPALIAPNRPTIKDLRNVASGKSRAGVSLAEYRDAQAAIRSRQETA